MQLIFKKVNRPSIGVFYWLVALIALEKTTTTTGAFCVA